MNKEELLELHPYWVETTDGAFTLAIHTLPSTRIDDWNNHGRKILTEIARDMLKHYTGQEVKKFDG